MNENSQFKNRKWVIRVAVIFFAVMFLLLFFSNTIYNYSLPQVTVVYSTPGQMTTAISDDGTVEAISSTKIVADGSHKIDTVLANLYDDVTAGDVLLMYKEVKLEDNEELKAAQKALDDLLEAEYKAGLTETPRDYSSYERSISDALDTLNEAKTKQTLAQNKAATIATAQSDLTAKQTILTTKKNDLAKIELDKEAKVSAVGTADANLIATQTALKPYQELIDLKNAELVTAKDILAKIPAGDDTTAAQAAVDAAQAAVDAAVATAAPYQAAVDAAQLVYDTASADLTAYAKTVADKEAEIVTAEKDVTDAQTKLADAEALPSVESAAEAVKMAQRSYDDAVKALDKQKKDDGIQDILDSMDDEDAKKAIVDAQKKVDDLTKILTATTVTAPISGRISQINVSSDSETIKGDVMIVIDDVSQGFKVSLTFTVEQVTQGQMVVGMGAREQNSWGGEEDDAFIVSIKPDPSNPKENRLVTFKLNSDPEYGGWYFAGQQVTLTLNNRSQNYECIIPLSAVHIESGKTFVYILKTKNSPLGDRYIAVQVPVTILAQDDAGAAINPDALGEYGSAVITETNDKSFQSGDQVRLAED